jgi:pyrroline-5-carboxylate reductase
MKIGVIGVGNIAVAVVRGLCRATPTPEKVLLSPRNAEKAAGLAAEFPQVEVAPDNQSVVDGSDWIIPAVRPPQARETLSAITFRPGQKVISIMAAVRMDELRELVAPVTDIARAVPQPSVAQHNGPIAIYPNDPETVEMFSRIGTAVPVDDEHKYDSLCTVTAWAAAHFAFLAHVSRWLVSEGVDKLSADRFAGAISQSISTDAAHGAEHGFEALIEEVSTPGGMNEQILRMLTEADWFAPLKPAFDAILDRNEGRS